MYKYPSVLPYFLSSPVLLQQQGERVLTSLSSNHGLKYFQVLGWSFEELLRVSSLPLT